MITAQKSHIMHVRATNFLGGPEKQIFEHIRQSKNYRHSIVTFIDGGRPNALVQKCQDAEIPVYAIQSFTPFSPLAIHKLRKIIAALKPSIICSHGYRPTILLPFAAYGLRLPIIGFVRGFTSENFKIALYESLERKTLPHLFGIVCVCHAQQRQLQKSGVRAKNWWVVHNAVSSPPPGKSFKADLRNALGIHDPGAIVVTAGRLSPEKGHKDLLQAISLMQQSSPQSHFLFCGDGPCRKSLEQDSRQLRIADRVHFLGFRSDMTDIYQMMDLLVLPSHTEGLPNVVLEAFSWGKPVVATQVGGVPELVQDGQNGLLVPAGRPDMMARAIERCLSSPEQMASMGGRGKDLALSQFSFEAQGHKLESVYAEILTQHAA